MEWGSKPLEEGGDCVKYSKRLIETMAGKDFCYINIYERLRDGVTVFGSYH